MKLGNGKVLVDVVGEEELVFSEHFSCPYCDFSVGDLEPRMFSFNSPFGACPECSGLGVQKKIDVDLLSQIQSYRLHKELFEDGKKKKIMDENF